MSPNPDVFEFLSNHQSMMHAAGTNHAFAQQQLNADQIAAIVQAATDHLKIARHRQEQYANSHKSELQLVPGQDVMLKTTNLNLTRWPRANLFPLWIGPFRVINSIQFNFTSVFPA